MSSQPPEKRTYRFRLQCHNPDNPYRQGHSNGIETTTAQDEISARADVIRRRIVGKTCDVPGCHQPLMFDYDGNPIKED